MKIDRLMGILTILLQRERVTAPALAKKYEVSRRTINRDIETLCQAGLPVITQQGLGGGISIAPGYKIDKAALSKDEWRALLAGLGGIESLSQPGRFSALQDKLALENRREHAVDAGLLHIDLSSHYKESIGPKIDLLTGAIEEKKTVAFDYYCPTGEGRREAEPYRIFFRWSAWYLLGYCTERRAFRHFKINRMWELNTQSPFTPRPVPPEAGDPDRYFTDEIDAVILFERSERYRLVEEYGPDCCTEGEDGRLLFRFSFTSKETLLGFVLSFGERAELLEPLCLRAEIAARIQKMRGHYQQT